MNHKKFILVVVALIVMVFPPGASGENIDPGNNGSNFAWGENVGWLNFKSSQGTGVTVGDAGLSGYIWGENIGWISLSCLDAGTCATVIYGVQNDVNGNLSGYAWGENLGWINFAPTGGGVTINACGEFNGYAWGENIGWISFRSDGPNPFRLITAWQSPIDTIPPVTTYSPAVQPWYKTDAVFNFSSTDCGKGVKEVRYRINSGPEIVTAGTAATATVTTEACNMLEYYFIDNANNIEPSRTLSVCIDKTPPTVSIITPANGSMYNINQPLTANFTSTDLLSGIASVTSSVPMGSAINTAATGNYTFNVTATDIAGNTMPVTAAYSVIYPGNMDPGSAGCKYVWAENVGWINFKPSWGPGVTVTAAAVTGKAWGENIGWINLSPTNGGVANDGKGTLSGYAWGENVGWINFKPANGGVTIGSDGKFSGYAWGENIGWINFSSVKSCVKSAWMPDTTPDPFGFLLLYDVALNTVMISNTITVTGIDSPSAVSITGGEYSINNGAFTSATGTVINGDRITVRMTSSNNYSTTTNAILTVGGYSGIFSVTTYAKKTIPDPFSFIDQTGVPLNTIITSNTITVTGINAPAPISFSAGSYSINGGAYTSNAGTVNNGDTVTVQQLSSSSYSTMTYGFLTIGGVSGIFRVTTMNTPAYDIYPNPDNTVYTLALQSDGKIPFSGVFHYLDGIASLSFARLNADGTRDYSFFPSGGGDYIVQSIAIQPDGKMLTGGNFVAATADNQPRNYVARRNADGSLDPGFDPKVDKSLSSVAVQADGKILISGQFTTVGNQPRNFLARLNADGSLDASFNPNVNNVVNSITLQADGKILICGIFNAVSGQPRYFLARLNADGSLDTGFDPHVNNVLNSIALQADGKILIGGWMMNVGGLPRNSIARLNADGTVDEGFDPNANNMVDSIALQADGKIIIGGQFTTVGNQPRNSIARLNADGSVDQGFDPNANGDVWSITIQSDGKILIAGKFTTVGGQPHKYMARLPNTDTALQALSALNDGQTITWMRGGASPEVWLVTFEQSNDGVVWNSLGQGTRIPGGWQITGLTLPMNQAFNIRARGYEAFNKSTSLIESTNVVFLVPTPSLACTGKPDGTACDDGNPCTENDVCTNGTCAGTPKPIDDGNICTIDACDPVTGNVTHTPVTNETVCDDGNKCTTNDVCTNGICAGTPVVCNDNNVCTGPDHCDALTGNCAYPPLTGTNCDDGDKCTTNDVCSNGVCAGTPIVCNDNNVCTGPDHCDPATGQCVFPPLTGAACDDGDKCTTNDVCTNGVCAGTPVVCNDNNVCTGPDHCNSATGLCVFPPLTGAACDDNKPCTINDVCANGTCAGIPKQIDDGNVCSTDACDPVTGNVTHTPVANGTPCDDGNPATINDVCTNGTCAGTRPNIFNGFFSPVDNSPTLNMANSGQTIPVKWRITDANGTPISDPASFKGLSSYAVSCTSYAGDSVDAIEEYSAGSSGLQYLGDGNWQFNWKTSKAYAGQCRMMVLTLGDKSTHTADFRFK